MSRSLKSAYLSSTAIAVLKLVISGLRKDYTIRGFFAGQFVPMLSGREMPKKPNVATEILENHIIAYGAEAFYMLLSSDGVI